MHGFGLGSECNPSWKEGRKEGMWWQWLLLSPPAPFLSFSFPNSKTVYPWGANSLWGLQAKPKNRTMCNQSWERDCGAGESWANKADLGRAEPVQTGEASSG